MLPFSRFSCVLIPHLFIIRLYTITYGSIISISISQMFGDFRFVAHTAVQR